MLTSCCGFESVEAQAAAPVPAADTAAPVAVPAAQETPEATALPAPQEAEEPVAVPAAQAEGTPIRYVYMSGDQKTIRIIGEIYRMTVADLLHNIKSQDGIEHSYCTLLVGENAYDEDDTSLLTTVLADVRNMGTEKLTVVKIPNYEKARKLVGEANYLSIEVWQQLLPAEELEAIVLPPLSDAMLAEIKRLQELDQLPILFLDLGKSIEEMETLCHAKGINVLNNNLNNTAERLRAEACYSAAGPAAPRWLLLPGSDHGVLPGSRCKKYDDQVQYMQQNYPGYEVGGARELVTLAMLKYLNDGTVLFSNDPLTYCRCKETFQQGEWGGKNWNIFLGSNLKNASDGVYGLVVGPFNHISSHSALWACFSFSRPLKKVLEP